MPRLNLTPEEVALVERHRLDQILRNHGWNEMVDAAVEYYKDSQPTVAHTLAKWRREP